MKRTFTVLFILLLSVLANAQVFNWEWQNPKPNGNDQNSIVALDENTIIAFGTAGSVQKSTNGGKDWSVSYVDNSSRDIKASCFVNNTLGYLCGTAGLLMKTTNAGATWTALTSGTTEDILSIDCYDKDTVYASGGNGLVLKTTNGGTSWTVSAYGTTFNYRIYALSASTIFMGSSGATTGRIIRSTNYGATWQSVTPATFTSGTVYGISFGDANNGVAVSSGINIYRTTDGGATWVSKTGVGSAVIYFAQFVSPTKVIAGDANGNLFVSNDAGETWTAAGISMQRLNCADFFNNTLYVSGTAGTVLKSTDNGVNWTWQYTALTQQLLRGISFYDANNGLACGGSTQVADSLGQMLKTTDGGKTWSLIPFNFSFQVYCFTRPSEFVWYAATGNNKIFKTTNGGVSFTSLTLPITGTTQVYWDIAASDNQTVYAAGASGKMIKTTDGGTTWTALNPNFGTNAVNRIKVFGNTVFAAGGGAKLAKSTDGGTTWTALTPNIPGTFFALNFKNQSVGYVAGSSLGASKTTDGGATWTALTMPSTLKSTTSLWGIAFGDTAVWMSSINGDILYSKDEGATWIITKKITSNNLFCFAVVGNNLWIAGGGGAILKGYSDPSIPVELTSFSAVVKDKVVTLNWKTATETNNRGFEIERKLNKANWESIGFVNGHGTTTEKKEYSFVDDKAVGNVSYRLKQVDFDGTYKYSSTVEVSTLAPGKFELAQNYPNPFNPVTNINFRIVSSSKVSLKIFDILGKEVASLINEVREAGNYTVQFDAAKLSSGIYYYTLTAGGLTDTKKMMLIK